MHTSADATTLQMRRRVHVRNLRGATTRLATTWAPIPSSCNITTRHTHDSQLAWVTAKSCALPSSNTVQGITAVHPPTACATPAHCNCGARNSSRQLDAKRYPRCHTDILEPPSRYIIKCVRHAQIYQCGDTMWEGYGHGSGRDGAHRMVPRVLANPPM